MSIKEKIDLMIEECYNALSNIGIAAQKYTDEHDVYLERDEEIKDSKFIKEKIKEKIAKVVDSE
jgi:hypothetical protein